MPRNGLNESTSLRMPTVNVTGAAVARPAPAAAAGVDARPVRARAARAAASAAGRERGVRFRPCDRRPVRRCAPQEPFEHTEHGVARPDPYHWMRRLDAPVLAHLAAEREWYDVATGHLGPLVQELRAEMTGRVPATDSSVSWPQHGYSYCTVLPAGREYVQLLRRRDAAGDDGAGRAAARRQRAGRRRRLRGPGALDRSRPDASLMAYSVDFDGDEVYELRFRDLASGADLADVVPRTAPGGAWSADSAYFFYTRPRRAVAAAPGLAAPARHARLRRRAGAGGAGRAVRARGADHAAPATWW